MRSGTKLLRIASLLQILFGVGYFLLARFLLGEGEVVLGDMSGEDALMTVLISYGGCAFQVLAGLVGLALANRRSLLTVLLGILLFLPVLANFLKTEGDVARHSRHRRHPRLPLPLPARRVEKLQSVNVSRPVARRGFFVALRVLKSFCRTRGAFGVLICTRQLLAET